MLLQGDPLSLLHEQGAEALMLELGGVSGGHGNNAAVHMELANNGAASLQLWPVALLREFPQSEQPDKDVLLRIFVAEESLPPTVGGVVPSHQLDLIRSDLVVDLLDANLDRIIGNLVCLISFIFKQVKIKLSHLSRAHIPALGSKILHSGESELPEVAMLHATGRRD